MRKMVVAIVSAVLVLAVIPEATSAMSFGVRLSAGPSLPVGDFGESTDIIEPALTGTYDAAGGGAEPGFGINVEMEAQATSRVFAGGRFGYSRFGADASDILEKGITPAEVKAIDATWTFTSLEAFVRVMTFETPALGVYGRVGVGASKVKTSFDIGLDIPDMGTQTITSDFSLGNRFLFTAILGGEYRMSESVYIIGELRYANIRSDGAEAGATVVDYEISGTQTYNMQTLDIVFGVRIPLSGM